MHRVHRVSPDVSAACAGTDVTKLHTVLNNIVAMFSQYSSTKFSVEPVAQRASEGAALAAPPPHHPGLLGRALQDTGS